MQSFSSLNSFANQSITITDLRGSRVLFDRVRPSGVSKEVTSSTVTINSYGTEILEIINYSTANVRFKIELKKAVGSSMSASVAFGGLPSGVTLSTTSTTWTLTGLKSKADWDAVKTTVWTLNASYASYPQWYFEYRITYYDSDLGEDVNVTWDVYDPDFYPISFVSASSSMSCRGDLIVTSAVGTPVGSPVTSYTPKNLGGAFTVATAANLSGVLATSSLASAFNTTCIGADLRLMSMSTTLNFVLASNIVFSKQSKARAALQSSFTLAGQLTYVVRLINRADFVANFIGGSPYEGTSGPGGVPYLEGNGYAYYNIDGSLSGNGMPIGLTRIRQGAATLSSSFTATCLGEDARLMSSMVMSSGTMTTTGRRLAGLTLNANVITAQTASANYVSRSSIVEAQSVTALVGSIVGPVRGGAEITAAATMTATVVRIKQLAVTLTSAVTMDPTIVRKTVGFVPKRLEAFASMSAEGFLNNAMVVHYTITNTTSNSGDVRTVYLPLAGTVACQVQWGDGTVEEFTTPGIKSHQYASIGSKTIKIYKLGPTGTALETFGAIPYADRGTNPGFSVGGEPAWWAPANLNWNEGISTFGSLGVTKIPQALLKVGGQVSNVPSTLASSITDLQYANIPNSSTVVGWNVVNVTTARDAFASDFNQPIGTWNVSGLTNAREMFSGCSSFNQSLNLWNVSNVTNMSNMFAICSSFNQSLNSWNVSNVTDMGAMFSQCYAFNGNITSWNTANVTTMGGMFYDCRAFNQPIGVWNTSSVTSMSGMFQLTRVFNQPLNNWNVSNVTNMQAMFSGARVFNQPLNSWNTANVTNMDYMFFLIVATAFDQNISSWPVPLIPSKPTEFDTGTLSSWTTAEKPNWGV